MKHNFEENKQKRIDNAKRSAQKSLQLSDQTFKTAKEMAGAIPFGQPILVGHHSEKRDRNYRGKIEDKFSKSFDLQKKAEYYAGKAEAIESNNAISSDDPKAVEKLTEKLNNLQTLQDFMKAANKCIKKKDREAFLSLEHATPQLWDKLNIPDCFNTKGFPSYRLTNNNANIKRIKQRIEQLQLIEARKVIDEMVNGVRIYENKEANRLQMIFEGKPADNIRKALKSHGFRWSPSQGAWQKNIGNWAYHDARKIALSISDSH